MRIAKAFGPILVVGIGTVSLAWAETQGNTNFQGRAVITLDDAPSARPSPSPSPRPVTRATPVAPRTAVPNTALRPAPVATPSSLLRFPAPAVRSAQQPVQRPVAPVPQASQVPQFQRPQFQRPQQPVTQPFAPQAAPQAVQRPVPRVTPMATATPRPAATEEAVDLNQLSASTPGSGANPHAAKDAHAAGTDPLGIGKLNLTPNFKFFFDLWLINQPNVMDFTFKNVHSYTFIDLMPDKKLTFSFSFNLASRANYFELGYQATPRLQFRGGKILIPFDDTFPHTMYGGRPNLSVFFMEGQTAFLPDLWAEPGVAAKYRIFENSKVHIDGTFYVTNGFQSNTGNPYPGQTGGIYPDFNGLTAIDLSDNNRDKAIGGRLESLWFRKFGLNGSFYTCRFSDQGAPDERLTALGLDSQLRLAASGTEFRAGVISMKVDLPSDNFTRSGWYLEAGQKFGVKRDWKALLRTGYRQNDNRVIEVSDQRLIGGVLMWRPGLVQWSFETWRDLNDVPGKVNYTLTALRAAVEL